MIDRRCFWPSALGLLWAACSGLGCGAEDAADPVAADPLDAVGEVEGKPAKRPKRPR